MTWGLLLAAAVLGQAQPEASAPQPNAAGLLAAAPLVAGQREQIRAALERRDYKLAAALLAKQMETSPGSAGLLTLAGRVYLLDKDPLNAAIAFKKSEQYAPLPAQDRFSLALALAGIRRGDLAREQFNELATADPGNLAYQYWLGRLDYDDQLYDSAVSRLRKVTAAKPEFARGWDNLALSLEGTGHLEEALQCYEKAVTLNRALPRPSPWPPLNQGTLLTKSGRLEEADKALREAVQYGPKLAAAHYRLGTNLQRQARKDEAIAELRLATGLAPNDPRPYYALGQIYTSQGNKQAAEEAYARFRVLKKAQRGPDK
ncbi:MAG: tetratricopeptide repeat protein [Bryobacterales bacterium]|nr:tetratricopeptide repeat protein [Bryobacterales bacterium]